MNVKGSYASYLSGMEKLMHTADFWHFEGRAPINWAILVGEPIQEASAGYGDEFVIRFPSGSLVVKDEGQSCCESRYITCDDELDSFVGAKLVGFEVVEAPDVEHEPEEDGYVSSDTHEQMFVKFETTMGTITLVTHNEHNGYYGGFSVQSYWRE